MADASSSKLLISPVHQGFLSCVSITMFIAVRFCLMIYCDEETADDNFYSVTITYEQSHEQYIRVFFLILFNRLSNVTGCQMAVVFAWLILLSYFWNHPSLSYFLLLEFFYTSVHIQWTQCRLVSKPIIRAIWQPVKLTAYYIEFGKTSTVLFLGFSQSTTFHQPSINLNR